MKLIAQVKLQPTEQQADALRRTMEAANRAANVLSTLAWDMRQFRQYDLQHLAYYAIRAHFDWSAQMTVRVISKVADAYQLDKKNKAHLSTAGQCGV